MVTGTWSKKINPDESSTTYIGGIYEVNKNSSGGVTGTKTYYPAGGAMRVDGTLYFVLKDHLGSASVVTDKDGEPVTAAEARYYPFGAARLSTSSMLTDKLYTGQRDTGLGIYYYGARFYSPYITQFTQPDTIVPNPYNPQSLNRYSYALNNPMRYTDPSGHKACEEIDANGKCYSEDDITEKLEKEKKKHKPGESRCKGRHCDTIEEILTGTVLGLDVIAGGVSLLEGLVAADAYILAGGACIASEFAGCAPAFGLAFGADMAATAIFALPENGLGMLSLGVTVANDYLFGNMGIDPSIGPYVGKDTVVSARNALAGFIPESFIDLGVSLSQVKYDMDRATGNKSGGYVSVADANSDWKMPPINKDFLKQIFLKDWW